jgi:phosphoglycolate phosphatase
MSGVGFDVVVFDLDGTLADTSLDLAGALNHVLENMGRSPIPPESVRQLVGHGARALLRKGLAATGEVSEALVDAGYPAFLEHYAANICRYTRPFDRLIEALDGLRWSNARIAVCTNKPEQLTALLLAELGWQYLFDAVIGGDTLPVKKPDPAPLLAAVEQAGGGRAVLVGDSITDADTARAAGVPFVAVSFGFSDRPASELGADAVIENYDELIPALRRISGAT